MKSRKEALRIAKKIFAASLKDGHLDESSVRKVVAKLSEARPRGYLEVADAYWRLVRLEVERNRAIIQSAVALDEPTTAGLIADLKKKYGPQITTEFSVDSDLLGGVKIRVGSDVWDGSVKNRLERLSEQFN
ncbi:MAG: ATP synthase F1 subunit delta [Verrucomicrobiia bacterium Tous-C2TDCM]|nr:MAG: ATP synthase F1 subunit delta [Verrucomicrobiae bacterium Tous-C2TDCM]